MNKEQDFKRIVLIMSSIWLGFTLLLPFDVTGLNIISVNLSSTIFPFIVFASILTFGGLLSYFVLLLEPNFSSKILNYTGLFTLLLFFFSIFGFMSQSGGTLPISESEFQKSLGITFFKWISIFIGAKIVNGFTLNKMNGLKISENSSIFKNICIVLGVLFSFHIILLYLESIYPLGSISIEALALFELIQIVTLVPCCYLFFKFLNYKKYNIFLNIVIISVIGPVATTFFLAVFNKVVGINQNLLLIPLFILTIAIIITNLASGSYIFIMIKERRQRKIQYELNEKQRILVAPKNYEELVKKKKILTENAESFKRGGKFEEAIKQWVEIIEVLKQIEVLIPLININSSPKIEEQIHNVEINIKILEVEVITSEAEKDFTEAKHLASGEEFSPAIIILNKSHKKYAEALKLAEKYKIDEITSKIRENIKEVQQKTLLYQIKLAKSYDTIEVMEPNIRSIVDEAESNVKFTPKVFKKPDREIDINLVSVMMPFKHEFDKIYGIIKDSCNKCGLDCKRVDDIWENSTIIQDVFTLLYCSSIVVCECTEKNANVFYEAGIAHTLGKELIFITQNIKDIPFDLRQHRFLKYTTQSNGLEKLQNELVKRLKFLKKSSNKKV